MESKRKSKRNFEHVEAASSCIKLIAHLFLHLLYKPKCLLLLLPPPPLHISLPPTTASHLAKIRAPAFALPISISRRLLVLPSPRWPSPLHRPRRTHHKHLLHLVLVIFHRVRATRCFLDSGGCCRRLSGHHHLAVLLFRDDGGGARDLDGSSSVRSSSSSSGQRSSS